MLTAPNQFIVNKAGEVISVILPIEEYNRLKDAVEAQDQINQVDAGRAVVTRTMSVAEAVKLVDEKRKNP